MRVEDLYHLQQLDQAIGDSLKRLKEIAARLEDSGALNEQRTLRDTAAARVPPLRVRARDLEFEIQTMRQKAKASEEQLYSGSVKNPKAMQEIQQEIASLKRRGDELEDTLLEIMLTLEESEAALASAEITLKEATHEWETTNADLVREQGELKQRVDSLKARREDAAKQLDPVLLKAYMTLRQRKVFSPVAVMQGRTCSVCGVEQTIVLADEVRRADRVVHCHNCDRILLYKI
jgi:predicted  nucleic acid-binding Zn-ribbon protein